jgi:hypothetical protein
VEELERIDRPAGGADHAERLLPRQHVPHPHGDAREMA